MNWSYFSRLPKGYRILTAVMGFTGLGIAVFLLVGYLVMFLWNQALAAVFDIPSITFWQAVGLFVLAKLFFGFGGGGQQDGRHKRRRERAPVETTEEWLPKTDDAFRSYWREEGKQAYEAYLARKRAGGDMTDERP